MSGTFQKGSVIIQRRGDTDLTDDFTDALEFPIASVDEPIGVSVTAKVEFASNSEGGGRTLTVELRGISPADASAIEEAGYVRLDAGFSDTGIGPLFFGKITGEPGYRFESGKLSFSFSATDQGEFYSLRPAISDPNPITIGEALTRIYEAVGAKSAIRGLAIPEIAFGSDPEGLYIPAPGKPAPDTGSLLNAVTLATGYTATKTFIEEIYMLCQELAKRLTDLYGRTVAFYPIMQKDGFSLYLVDPTLFTTEVTALFDVSLPNVITAQPIKSKSAVNYESLGQTGTEAVQDQANVSGSTVALRDYELTCDLESALDLGVKVGVLEGVFNRIALFTVESGTHTIATGSPWRTSVRGRMADAGYIEVPADA